RAEALREMRLPARGERAERQAVERSFDRQNARAFRGGTPELERRFVRFGARVREQDARKSRRRSSQELLREQAGQQRDSELHRSRCLQLERLDQRVANAWVVSPDAEHLEAAEHVEEPV